MTWKRLGARIRELRDERGWSREMLAEQAGVSAVYLKKLEAGERVSPSFDVLDRLARALGATLHVEIIRRQRGGRHGR